MGNRGPRYSSDLARAQFCLVPPGGDGWSSRVDDAVRQACNPQACNPKPATPKPATRKCAKPAPPKCAKAACLLWQVRHGCIPVIIMDGVHMPFEGVRLQPEPYP